MRRLDDQPKAEVPVLSNFWALVWHFSAFLLAENSPSRKLFVSGFSGPRLRIARSFRPLLQVVEGLKLRPGEAFTDCETCTNPREPHDAKFGEHQRDGCTDILCWSSLLWPIARTYCSISLHQGSQVKDQSSLRVRKMSSSWHPIFKQRSLGLWFRCRTTYAHAPSKIYHICAYSGTGNPNLSCLPSEVARRTL